MKEIEFKELNEQCGIYCIKNIDNNKIYIGSSKNLYDRLHQHFYNLKYNKHHSLHLQASYNKYGAKCFDYDILEFCTFDELYEHEQYWIDTLKPEYNKRLDAERNSGLKVSDETKEKISNTLKDKYATGEITTYKQEHAWIKVYLYNCETYSFIDEFENMASAYRFIFNKNEKTKVNTRYSKLFKILNKKFILTDYPVSDIKNMCLEIQCKLQSKLASYIVSEFNDELTYYRTIDDCCKKTGAKKTTLVRHLKGINIIYELKNGVKIYYLAQYKPI